MIEFHPLANLFPLVEGEEFAALVRDVKANGVREWIVMHDGMILDGRNRFRAGVAAGIWPKDFDPYYRDKAGNRKALKSGFEKLNPCDGDPLAYVLSKNLARRHLSENQRSMVAARIANMPRGERTDLAKKRGEKSAHLSQPEAAAVLAVSARSLRSAKEVQEKGTAELVRAVDAGKMAVSLAAQASRLDPAQQKLVVAEVEAGRANAVRTVVKRAARAAKEKTLAAKQCALPDKRYGVILDDPEWQYEVYSRETGLDRAADNHYPTSDLETINARDVGALAAADCARFTWTTAPFLAHALKMLEAQGFAYKTHCIWVKRRPGAARGTGYWFTGEHEILILSVRGNPPAPAPGTQWASVIEAGVGAHSQKPAIFHELIEAYFPNLPRIELNARTRREGWDAWGNETPDGEGE